MMNIIVAPISGNHFPVQLAGYRLIIRNKIQPDIIFAGSGGSVTSYCWMCSDDRLNALDVVMSELNSGIFVKKRSENFVSVMPDTMQAIFAGAVYEVSDEAPDFLDTFFCEESIQSCEIWVAAINQESGRVGLFCNKSKRECHIQSSEYDGILFNSERLKYLRGNIKDIAYSILASAAIPFFIQPAIIDGQKYIDCGAEYASSLTPLQTEVRRICTGKNVHIIYLSAYNTDNSFRKTHPQESRTLLDLMETIPNHFVRGLLQQDRAVAHNIISDGKGTFTAFACVECFDEIIQRREKCNSSLIELYPIEESVINIFDFCRGTVGEHVDSVQLGIRIWWTGDQSVFNGIEGFVHREVYSY